jgi:hypothetical protein
MALQHIRLEMARNADFPDGSAEHGYEFIAPLTDDGHLDAEAWHANKDACTVKRFWGTEPDEHGHLVHLGHGWRFHYPGEDLDEDEPLFKLDRHTVREGDYISINEDEGLVTFRVVSVRPSPLG